MIREDKMSRGTGSQREIKFSIHPSKLGTRSRDKQTREKGRNGGVTENSRRGESSSQVIAGSTSPLLLWAAQHRNPGSAMHSITVRR